MGLGKKEEDPGVPAWVVTFGDMMSLLLTFFVMLLSMSDIKEEESKALIESLRRQFGHETSIISSLPGPVAPTNSVIAKLASMGRAQRANTMNGGDKVKAAVGDYPRVTAIRVADDTTHGTVVFFTEGYSELNEEIVQRLQAAVGVLIGKPQKILVRGHTSSRPLKPDSPYRDHFDLAYARCHVVRDYLIKLGINPKRLDLNQPADSEPLYTGHDPEKLKLNSRVEVIMVDKFTEDLEGTQQGQGQESAAEGVP